MHKKIITIIIILLTIIFSGIFIIKNSSSKKIDTLDFMVIKGVGKNLYHFNYPYKKGMTAKEIIIDLEIKNKEIIKIMQKKKITWITILPSTKIYENCSLKVQFK